MRIGKLKFLLQWMDEACYLKSSLKRNQSVKSQNANKKNACKGKSLLQKSTVDSFELRLIENAKKLSLRTISYGPYGLHCYNEKIKISVTANDLYQFVMNNQDEDPLVKECYVITRIVSFLRCMKLAASNQIIWKLIKGGSQKWDSVRHEEKMFNVVKAFYSLKNLDNLWLRIPRSFHFEQEK